MAKESKTRVDYHHLTVEKLSELVAELGDKAKDFDANSFVEFKPAEGQARMVDVLDASGNPVHYIGKDGKTKIRKKRVIVGKEKVKYFNFMKAKRKFYETFIDEFDWYNKPKVKKEKDDNTKVKDALEKMGVILD